MNAWRFIALVTALTVIAAVPANARGRGHHDWDNDRVGHRVEILEVRGSAQNEPRQLRVHLWYPADKHAYRWADDTVYTSWLHGEELLPDDDRWAPLRWSVDAQIARDTDEVDGKQLPAIVFSHGAMNDPIDYAHTLEALAAEGFVVAAPYHVNNTQDDVRVDFINGQIFAVNGKRPFACEDGLTFPCSHTDLARSMQDRVSDISAIIGTLPVWLGKHVDASHVGVLGHSRGTVTALAAAGGSLAWGFPEGGDPQVKAIMGMAIGGAPVTAGVDLADVTVPTVLVSGAKDFNSVPAVSEAAYTRISSADKLIVRLPLATHRSFDSTYCAQLQSAGEAFDTDPGSRGVLVPDEVASMAPILDRHTFNLIAASPPAFLSGKAVHYCARRFFTRPVNIERLVAATPNAEYACQPEPASGTPECAAVPALSGACAPGLTRPPCTGLDTGEVSDGMTKIAAAFFGSALRREAGVRFSRWLSPAWLVDHVRMVGSAEAVAGPDSVCRPHSGVTCTGAAGP